MILTEQELIDAPMPFHKGERCQNCQYPIQKTHYDSAFHQWEHYDPRSSFRDNVWQYCRGTRAEP